TRTWTWQQFYDETLIAAQALVSIGFNKGDSVNIIGFNSPEYFLFEMGAAAAAGKAAGIYTTNSPDACHYVSEHSGAVVVAVQNDVQLKKYLQIRSRLPKLKAIVCWEMKESELPANEVSQVGGSGSTCEILTWSQFMAKGRKADSSVEREIMQRIDSIKPGDAL